MYILPSLRLPTHQGAWTTIFWSKVSTPAGYVAGWRDHWKEDETFEKKGDSFLFRFPSSLII
jgi:hypothetical protein